MRKHPVLLGLIIIGVILGVFLLSIFFLTRFGEKKAFALGDKIAVVDIKGMITSSREVVEQIDEFKEDNDIKAIILRINSPGGGVGPSQEIYREVLRAKEKKKIITSMESVAASGGYYVACASHLIVANPGTITGSIGVVMEFSNIEDLLKKIGLRSYVIKSGKHKDIGSPLREMTPEEKAILQDVIDSVHNQFVRAVAEGRNMEEGKVKQIADGRIFSGEQAKELGLVDRLGGLQDAIEIAAEMVGIKGKPAVIYPKRKLSLYELLFRKSLRLLMDEVWQREYRLSYLMYSP
ncbi:MAG: signal peptide peptidase SppA [Syntrophobacterales bacterium]|nr:MAG: signal peptide peptidase SppA [Syntrophobacterales bacterium]